MAIFYAAFFAFGGIQMPYLPVWLANRGLDARDIGILLAVPMLARVVALPLTTRVIDRRFDPRVALMITAILTAAGYAVMAGAHGFAAILVAYVAISIVYAPVLPLGDSYGRGGGATAQGDFSALQGVTFAAAMALAGELVEKFGSYAYFAMAPVAATGFVIAAAGRQAWRVEADHASPSG
jgi:MFS transporter, PPP family, 3-phenylpropionic acid transporter